CAGSPSVGIVSLPKRPEEGLVSASEPDTGLLIVVGGPQYRIGSHRLFVQVARHVAAKGYPAMRFDYRGMGDSWAEMRHFQLVNDDLRSAIDTFFDRVPSLKKVVLWGLCDGASASCLYASTDPRVSGLILINPWAHTTAGSAATRLRHYYVQRLREPAFWRKLIGGRVRLQSLQVLFKTIRQSLASRHGHVLTGLRTPVGEAPETLPLPARMGHHVCRSGAHIAIALSNGDKVAQEFEDHAMPTPPWKEALSERLVELVRLQGADHTLSEPEA